MAERARRKFNRRELPLLFLLYSVLFAVAAVVLPLAANADMASESELHSITGTVQKAPRTTIYGGRGEVRLDIFIQANDGLHHLTQEDLTREYPEIMNLKAGDNVTVRVKDDSLGLDLDWLWELRRDGATILSYEDTYRFMERRNVRIYKFAHWAGVLSAGFFALAVLLRRHFGAWRDSRKSSPADCAALRGSL